MRVFFGIIGLCILIWAIQLAILCCRLKVDTRSEYEEVVPSISFKTAIHVSGYASNMVTTFPIYGFDDSKVEPHDSSDDEIDDSP